MILVVGGAGYIGSHVCRALRDQGIAHVVFDNLEEGFKEALGPSELVVGDLRKAEDVVSVIKDVKPSLVMHFGAYISVGESVRQPAKYFLNNTSGVVNLLTAMAQNEVTSFVFSSTAAVYGEPEYVPIDEEHPKRPTSPYGESKYLVERMLPSFESAYGIRSVCLRYFNASGAQPDGTIGEAHRVEEHLIPLAIKAAAGQRGALKVFGTDYPTPDGTCIRDYIHVVDLANAHLLAVSHLLDNGSTRQFNLGSGTGFSVREVIETVSRVTGLTVPYEDSDRRPGDPAQLIASSKRIREELGWEPVFDNLERIVADAWNWHQAHPSGYA
ncbi:MAG TPA: UDP-glucose 4-epimerase GalE [Fimbriimonadaceae bacterium]|nr:UDP-glucose 4-epimerase GalE [Fimbriimonadaceae bacterium]